MPDEVHAFDPECNEEAIEVGGKARCMHRLVERFGRTAVAGQIERDDATALRERRLIEHPGVQISAKPMHKQYRRRISRADVEYAYPFAAGVDIAWRQPALHRRVICRWLRRDES